MTNFTNLNLIAEDFKNWNSTAKIDDTILLNYENLKLEFNNINNFVNIYQKIYTLNDKLLIDFYKNMFIILFNTYWSENKINLQNTFIIEDLLIPLKFNIFLKKLINNNFNMWFEQIILEKKK